MQFYTWELHIDEERPIFSCMQSKPNIIKTRIMAVLIQYLSTKKTRRPLKGSTNQYMMSLSIFFPSMQYFYKAIPSLAVK